MQESLKVYTLDSDSYNYAVAYANIGKAYLLMSYLSQTNVNIDRALSAYEEALKVFKISQFPFNYASVQIDLGEAYTVKAGITGSEEDYNNAQMLSIML